MSHRWCYNLALGSYLYIYIYIIIGEVERNSKLKFQIKVSILRHMS